MSKEDIVLQHSEKAFLSEENRANYLENKAEKFIAAIVVIIGLHLVDINKLTFTGTCQTQLSSWFAAAALVAFGIAIVVALLSRRIENYLSYPRGKSLIDELSDSRIGDEESKLLIAHMYLRFHDQNARINDKRAKLLSLSGHFLVTGFFTCCCQSSNL